MTWRDPTRRGGELLDAVLTAEGLDPGDPPALQRGRDALTNAMTWIWRQADWEWAVSPDSPVRFPTYVTAVLSSGIVTDDPAVPGFDQIYHVDDAAQFHENDWLLLNEGRNDESFIKIVDVTSEATFRRSNALQPAPVFKAGDRMRLLGPIIADANVAALITPAGFSFFDIAVTTLPAFPVGGLLELFHFNRNKTEFHRLRSLPGQLSGNERLRIGDPSLNTDSILNVSEVEGDGRVRAAVEASSPVYLRNRPPPTVDPLVARSGPGIPRERTVPFPDGPVPDFGRALSVSLEGFGPLVPISSDDWSNQPRVPNVRSLHAGDGYVIHGEPPQLSFAIRPAGVQTIVMHYLRAPTRFFGDDDVPLPYPFQSLLTWSARILLRKDGPPGAVLRADGDVMSEVARLKSYSVNADRGFEMRSLT